MTAPTIKDTTDLMYAMEKCSDDQQTQVGCVIADFEGNILATGANRMTPNMKKIAGPELFERPEKYDWIEHAERDAIYDAARRGVRLQDAQMHLPGFPCVECARAIANSGIIMLTHGSTEGWDDERYKFSKSRAIMEAAGVHLVERQTDE